MLRILSRAILLPIAAVSFLWPSLGFAQTAACGTTTWDLTAGHTIDVGTVTVSNDATNLYVTYTLDDPDYPDATFGTLHLWVGTDLANMPAAPNGAPIPGQFPYKAGTAPYPDSTGAKNYTFTVPLVGLFPDVTSACTPTPKQLYIVTHAEVFLDGDSTGDHETAFGGPTPGTGPRWWFYGVYTICCDSGPPPIRTCQTAFGKGGWVFTTDRKSNPENLPTLGLSKNRWGWAIKIPAASGTWNYDIWAGAGLNKTGNGTKVGTLRVDWNGSQVRVTYTLFAPFDMEELHIYAGDASPTTVAPGQYGYTEYFDPPATSHTATFDVTDAGVDGIWIIAHAVTCRAQPS